MDWFRDKTKNHLFVLLSEHIPKEGTKLSLINIDTNRIHPLMLEGRHQLIQACLDESPQRVLLLVRRKGDSQQNWCTSKFTTSSKRRCSARFKSSSRWSG